MNDMSNIFVNFENGESVLIHTNQISPTIAKKWAEKATGENVLEAYFITDDEIQYYCFDDRVWVDTPEKAKKIREFIDK